MAATASNRDLRRTAVNHADVLEKFGACLDSQADAIKGLAENQRILADGFKQHLADLAKEFADVWKLLREHDATVERSHAWRSMTFWQRVSWLLKGL